MNVTEPSYMGYFALGSSATVDEAVMSSDQYFAFSQYGGNICDGSAASYSESCGQSILNGLLILPGSYYLVVSSQSSTQVNFGYNASLALQVENATTHVGAFITLSADSHADFMVHDITIGSPSAMQIFGISTQPVDYQVTDLLQKQVVFTSADLTTTNLNGTMPQQSVQPYYDLSLSPSLYQLTISNPQSSDTEVYFEYQITPAFVNPFKTIIENNVGLVSYPSAPMGAVSYGVYNNSGTITPYAQPIMTEAISGATMINAIQTNITTANYEDASNQLNGMLVVNNNDGSSYVYWSQDVPAFLTHYNELELDDDVLNVTGDYATLTNQSITSPYNNIVSQGYFGIQNNPQYYMNSGLQSYTLPLEYTMVMDESVSPGVGVTINMSVDFIKGVQHPGLVTFDQITIHDPNVQTAYFYVSGTEYTPGGLAANKMYYDAENIFGGGGGGAEGYFTQFSAHVNIGYWNSEAQNFTVFPSAYTFGGDTGETAANIHETYDGSGVVGLDVGSANWQYIYPSSVKSAPSSNSLPETIVIISVIIASATVSMFFLKKKGILGKPPA
ncbi:MAG: thermopsin [Thaumarchaeota archaeon]|nr:thermopsin [Nitrososphaerota archaeon]